MKSKNEYIFNKRFNILFLDGTLKITKILIILESFKVFIYFKMTRLSEFSCESSQAYILKV